MVDEAREGHGDRQRYEYVSASVCIKQNVLIRRLIDVTEKLSSQR